ncbi:MAG: ferredoxin-thioredoxin reductase catalytic domain-containing protein [archaeon]
MEELIKIWTKFCEVADFSLNEKDHVENVAKGVLQIESQTGLRMCPCRLRDGTRNTDLELLCPCNFKIQKTWTEQGRCWCGLFVKH